MFCLALPDLKCYLYNVEYGRVVGSFRAHDDSVSCLQWLRKEHLLISGGWDCVVRVWENVGKTGQALRGLRAEFDHDAKISTVAFRYRRRILDIIVGTSDGEVFIWDYSAKELINKITSHSTAINGVCFLREERIVTVSECGDLNVTDLNVLNSVYQKRLSSTITSLCCDGTGVLWLGGSAGSLLQWNMITVTQLSEQRAHEDLVRSIYFDFPTKTLITSSDDKSIKVWQLTQIS